MRRAGFVVFGFPWLGEPATLETYCLPLCAPRPPFCPQTLRSFHLSQDTRSLMRQQYGPRARVLEDVAGGTAEQHFAQTAVRIGTHDEQAGIMIACDGQ